MSTFVVMAELQRLISTRKYKRSQITLNFNQRLTFSDLPISDRLALKQKLESIEQTISEMNVSIQTIVYNPQDEDGFLTELSTCDDYENKLDCCLTLLSEPQTSQNLEIPSSASARSILKCPTAPLPIFNGYEDENLTRFITQF